MKSLVRLTLILVACSIASLAQTRSVLLTKDNYEAFHSQLKLQPDWKTDASSALNASSASFHGGLPDQIQIGVFYAIMWPTGEALYEFDWNKDNGQACPPDCTFYGSDSIQFSNIIVNVNGVDSSSGPFNEKDGLGLAWFIDPSNPILSACQPLTQMSAGGALITYRSSCIDVALQLIFPTKPYTFTLLNGQTFTTRGVDTSFIVPLLGKTELSSYCDADDFCKGQVIPIYAQRVTTAVK